MTNKMFTRRGLLLLLPFLLAGAIIKAHVLRATGWGLDPWQDIFLDALTLFAYFWVLNRLGEKRPYRDGLRWLWKR